jgi:dCMP deaminase
MKKAVILYAPALHEGYVRFLDRHKEDYLYVVTEQIRDRLAISTPYFGRDVRMILSSKMFQVFIALGMDPGSVSLFTDETIEKIKSSGVEIVMPDEDISHEIAKLFSNNKINYEPVFLRWDQMAALSSNEVRPDVRISKDVFEKEMVALAVEEGNKSGDWWRQVGAVVVRDGKVIISKHNTHMPRPDNNDVLGDPRSNFNAGESIEISTAIHAEAGAIAEAARKGISLDGADMYVSTFPCPNCAKLIVRSGIKKIAYVSGYSLVDAYDILKTGNVEIVKVD